MKSSIFAALLGLATAGGQLRNDLPNSSSFSTSTSTTYSATTSNTGSSGLQTFLPAVSVGNDNAKLNGVSDIAATSLGTASGISTGFSSGSGGISNIGTGSVLLTSTTTGQSKVISGSTGNGEFPKADITGSEARTAYLVDNNAVVNGVVNNAISNTATANLNLNKIFSKLPSLREVDNLILTADSVALLKLIQSVGIDTTIPCDQRIAYLLELNGRIKSAIQKKKFTYDKLKIVIDSAVVQIQRLERQIEGFNREIDLLGLDELNGRLRILLFDLQAAYTNYNQIDSQLPVLEAQVVGKQKEVEILNKNSENERNAINNNTLKLNDIITQINSLQAKLQQLLDRQAAIQAAIARGEATVVSNESTIASLKAKISNLKAQLADLNDQADKFNSVTKDLEVKVGRIRTDISVADAKKTKYLNQIAKYQDKIDIEKKKSVAADYNKLISMVDNLKRIIPNIQSEVDRHYYFCFGNGKVQVDNSGGVIVYIVRGDAFGNYLRNLYGRNIVLPAVNGDVLFNRVDIFGTPWVSAFGYPFGEASLGGTDLVIGGSFGCASSATSVVRGVSTITAIGANWIQGSTGNGARTRFNLGSCSRLQSVKQLPVVGQNFYWSGVPAANQSVNLFTGSCI